MPNEDILKFLEEKLDGIVNNVASPRERRVFGETDLKNIVKVIQACKDWGFVNLGNIIGLDRTDRFEVIYQLYDGHGLLLNLKTFTPRENPVIPSVSHIFPAVFLYERELMDLFGIQVEGTPPNRRYPLPDDWPVGEYPLRKDWKGLPMEVAAKEEVNS